MKEFLSRIHRIQKLAALRSTLVLLGLAVSFAHPTVARAQAAISATNNRTELIFPVGITFRVDLSSDAMITKVVLEYGLDKLTCAAVTSSANANFTPSKNVSAYWTWEMRQTGSEPAGARIWWRWRITNADGKEFVTDRQTVIWLDNQHQWQTVKGDRLILHWYAGDQNFGNVLYESANKSLADLETFTGLKSDAPPDVYIYANQKAMLEARLFAPTWSGGVAYGHYNIVLLGIALQDITWGKGAIAHELTHVLDLRATFSCLNNRPTWITEGLAMVGEGGLDAYNQGVFNTALAQDRFITLRSLAGNFPDDRVYLAYAQSWSVVNFLITEYGKDKFWVMLRALQNGATIDNALRSTYNFDTDGLEDAWRAKIGAKPRAIAGQSAAATTPTTIPTSALVQGFQFPTRTPSPNPTSTATSAPTQIPPAQVAVAAPAATATIVSQVSSAEKSSAPDNSIIMIAGVLVVLIVAVAIVLAMKRNKEMK